MRSPPATRASTEVFLTRLSAWLHRGGKMILNVWGNTM